MNSTGTVARTDRPAGDPTPGYRLVRRLGQGGYADVWEAEAPGGFRVALKVVRPTVKTRSGELRAIEVIRRIRHPHLLVPFGAWEVDGVLVIAMELADRSLWDRFRQAHSEGLRGIPRRELLGYLSDAATAIDHLNGFQHLVEGRPGVGIQHRDLKPQNILLFGGSAKVADFGMVRVMEESTAGHTGTWTLPYAAPEFFHGRTARQSDQYSLAVTYCQLRGGRLPFWGTPAEIMLGHTSMAPDLERLPEAERPVVARALAKQPDERWPDCRSFLDALRSLGSGEGVDVPDTLPADEPYEDDVYNPFVGQDFGNGSSSSFTLRCPSPSGGGLSASASSLSSCVDGEDAPDLFLTDFPEGTGDPFIYRGQSPGDEPSSVTREQEVVMPPGKDPVRAAGPPESHEPVSPPGGPAARRPLRLLARCSAILLTAGLTLGAVLSPVRPVSGRREAPGVHVVYKPPQPAPVAVAVRPEKGPDPVSVELTPVPEEPPAVEPPRVDFTPQVPALAGAEKLPVDVVVTSTVASVGATRDRRLDELKVEPPPAPEAAPVVAIPDTLTLRAGDRTRVPVQVNGGEAGGPYPLEFRGLPRGVAVECPPVGSAEGTAEAVFSAAEDAGPADVEVAVALAARPDDPATRFRIRVLPADPTAVYERGRALLKRGEYKRAVAEFTEALRRDPDHTGARFSRGLAYQLDCHFAEALADYSETVRRHPEHAGARLLRGRVHQERGELAPAAADLTAAIRLEPKNANAYLARARVFHESGAYDKALADYTEAARLRPDDPSAYYRRGLLRYHTGDFAGAVADHSAAIRLSPKYAKALRARSEAYARLGDKARAAADRDAFVKLAEAARPAPPPRKASTAKR